MYCPKCFSDTLSIHSRGVVRLLFNSKQMDTSQFLFNLKKDSPQDLLNKLRDKVVEFFDWYGQFQNKTPIKTVEIYSGDFVCKNGCALEIHTKLSLQGLIFNHEDVLNIIKEEAGKRGIPLDEKLNSDV